MKILEEFVSSALILDAAKYYYSYYPVRESDSIRNARALSFIASTDFLKNNFYQFGNDYIFEAQKYRDAIKQHIFCIYFFNSVLNELKKGYFNLVEDIKSKTQKINNDLLYLKKIAMQNAISREYEFNKATVINNFKDSGSQNYSNFLDFKTNTILSRSDMVKSKDQMLHLDQLENNEIVPNELNLVFEETRFTSLLFENDINNLLYDSEPFKFIVFCQTKDKQNFEILKNDGQITFMFEFNSPQKINKLRIDSASSSAFIIKQNNLRYLNLNTNLYESIEFISNSLNENIDLYFETFETNKIKITLTQTVWVEEKTIDNIYGKIFDYSVDRIQFFYTNYKPFGVFRSGELVPINSPLSLEYSCDYFFQDEDCYVEYYLDLMLYGEEDFDAFNYIKQTENTIVKQTPRLKEIIPYPREMGTQKELLAFNSYKAKILFVPNTGNGTLKIFRKTKDVILQLTPGLSYEISTDFSETFGSPDITDTIYNTIAGSHYIKLKIETELDRKIFIESEYYATYDIAPIFFLNREKTIGFLNNKIVFFKNLQESVGYVRPIIIFRTKDYQFDSTSFISSIKIVCEEKELNKDSYIELIDFVEYISQGDGNVVI
jgi:hypothetical protein